MARSGTVNEPRIAGGASDAGTSAPFRTDGFLNGSGPSAQLSEPLAAFHSLHSFKDRYDGERQSRLLRRDQFLAVLAHLPAPVRPAATFAYITGWRIDSEVLPLEWRQVDFGAGEVRLRSREADNGEGRTFPTTRKLREVLEQQRAITENLQRQLKAVCPRVFHRSGRPIKSFPRRIPDGLCGSGESGARPARLPQNGGPQPRPRRHSRTRGDADDRAQDRERVRAIQCVSAGDRVRPLSASTPTGTIEQNRRSGSNV